MKQHSYFYLLAGLAIGCFLCFPPAGLAEVNPNVELEIKGNGAGENSDVIAVRVMPNPNHYSASRWYRNQEFSGSPQALIVDGYDAVRDGRTVYVNAANVDQTNKLIYTNIYLISYNQDSDFKTVDVLGQIISHWRFNSNLSVPGNCQISTLRCLNDSECDEGQSCVGAGEAPGRCLMSDNDVCYTDDDCISGLYCNNLRSKVARDVRRLGSLGELRTALINYKKANNKYPVLGAGTYLPLNSISIWPSWQALFLPQVGAAQSLTDPINNLGSCAGYDPQTCWNEDTKKFADPRPNDNIFELPAGSYAYTYASDKNGSNFSLCTSMESKELGYNTTEGQLADMGCVVSGSAYVGSSNNKAPELTAVNLQGETDQEFNGYIKVTDSEGNPLDWSINTGGTTWTNWKNNGANNAAPQMRDTSNPNQKKIYAQAAGNPGIYNLSLTVNDGEGGTLSTVTPITITNDAPLINSDDIQYYPSTTIPLTIRFSISDKHQPVSYTLTKAMYNSGPYDLLASGNSTFLGESSNTVGNKVDYTLKYNLTTGSKFRQDINFVYVITAKDVYNNIATRQLNITVKADPPVLDFNCADEVRVGTDYYCGLGWKRQGDHVITYSAANQLPAGISLVAIEAEESDINNGNENQNTTKATIWKRIALWFDNLGKNSTNSASAAVIPVYYALKGKPSVATTSFPIMIKAENEYGAQTLREFTLNINNYCGDGVRQQSNLEGRGGFYNDGYEDCDGNSGIILNRGQIGSSNSYLQYGCLTEIGSLVPYPIMDNQYYCVYKSGGVEEGGGFCGDGICQAKLKTKSGYMPWEDKSYCQADCSCDGENQGPIGGNCVCDDGWFDCDSEAGCESQVECGTCSDAQYRCGSQCYNRSTVANCNLNSPKCSTGSMCDGSCEVGMYNCDGINECEASECTCPTGYSWVSAIWPKSKCVVEEIPSKCPTPLLECGDSCYNPATQKCCYDEEVCGASQSCCKIDAAYICVGSLWQCAELQHNSGGNTGGITN